MTQNRGPIFRAKDWSVELKDPQGQWSHCAGPWDFEAQPGKALGIIGPSGCGKSVTVQSLLGLYDPRHIRLAQAAQLQVGATSRWTGRQPYVQLQRTVRRELHRHWRILFQNHRSHLNPLKSIGRHFADHSRLCGQTFKPEDARTCLEKVGCACPGKLGLERWLKAFPHQLSGGEAQRIQLALALVPKHLKLLVCDEVTSNLDAHLQWQVLEQLKTLMEGMDLAIVFISHHTDHVHALCSETLDMTLSNEQTDHTIAMQETPTSTSDTPEQPDQVQAIIHIKKLNKHFGSNQVLQEIDLQIQARERYALIGESGSGKSTLGRLILGTEAHDPHSGQIEVLGQKRRARQIAPIKGVQMVFQNPSTALNPYMTLAQHVRNLAKRAPTADPQKVKADMQQLQISHLGPQNTATLSGGEQKRLLLVEALSLKPAVLIADEPTAGLDYRRKDMLLQLLANSTHAQTQQQPAQLIISHDLNLVTQYAHRIGVLLRGQLVQEIQAEALRQGDQEALHPYTELLLQPRNAKTQNTQQQSPSGCVFYHHCPRAPQVDCAYRNTRPPVRTSRWGWSRCPYPKSSTNRPS